MKLRNATLAALLLIVIGIVLIVIHNEIKASGLVVCAAVIFLLTSVINLFTWQRTKNAAAEGKKHMSRTAFVMGWITCLAGILLGVAMLLFIDTFVSVVPVCLGILLAAATLSQIYAILIGVRPVRLPAWFWAFPGAMAVCTVWVLCLTAGSQDAMMMVVTGIGTLVYGTALAVEGIMLKQYDRLQRDFRHAEATEGSIVVSPSADDGK